MFRFVLLKWESTREEQDFRASPLLLYADILFTVCYNFYFSLFYYSIVSHSITLNFFVGLPELMNKMAELWLFWWWKCEWEKKKDLWKWQSNSFFFTRAGLSGDQIWISRRWKVFLGPLILSKGSYSTLLTFTDISLRNFSSKACLLPATLSHWISYV